MNTILTRSTIPASLLTLLLSALPAHASEPVQWGSFGVGIGTGGLGIDYAYPVNPYLDIRAGYDFGSLKRDSEEEGVDYEVELKFSSARLIADYKPFKGGFRLSAGLYTGSPELELDASGEDDYEVGDRTYFGDADIAGDIDLGSTAPYLGLGWGGTAGTTGLGVSFDIGVLFTDKPEVALSVPRGMVCDATDGDCDPATEGFDVTGDSAEAVEFRAQVENERQNLEDDSQDYDLWPIIRLGLHYRY